MSLLKMQIAVNDRHRELVHVVATSGIFFFMAVMLGVSSFMDGGNGRVLFGVEAVAALTFGVFGLLKLWRGNQSSLHQETRVPNAYAMLISGLAKISVWGFYGFALPIFFVGVGFKILIPAHPILSALVIAVSIGAMLMASALIVNRRHRQKRRETA